MTAIEPTVQSGPDTPAPTAARDIAVWEAHMAAEFVTHSADDAVATMTEDAYVDHVPVLTGARGKAAVRAFYADDFIPQTPPDFAITLVTRTVGPDRVVDEMVATFTHTAPCAWLLPGLPPTGRRVAVPMVAAVDFRDGLVAGERIYWDQASVLVQLGLLNPAGLPIAGAEAAGKVLELTDATRPAAPTP